jgi:hypothetical protein
MITALGSRYIRQCSAYAEQIYFNKPAFIIITPLEENMENYKCPWEL